MLKIIRWVNKNKLIIFLSILAFSILAIPLFRYGVSGTFFYNLDPDIVYLSNAILYIKTGTIFYADHPGTLMVILLSWLYIPSKIITKFYFHQNFIQWSFDNITLLMFYSRIFSLILFSSGLFIFLKVINKRFKSIYITLFAFLAFFAVMRVENAISVVPENFSILLTAIWLLFFTKFINCKSYKLNIILIIISAFAVANKFTNLFLLIPSLLLPILIKGDFYQKITKIVSNTLISTIIFFLGIFPLSSRFNYLIDWIKSLFLHADIYGRGVESIFDLHSYTYSVKNLILGAPIAFAIIFSTLILSIYLLYKRKVKIREPIVFLSVTTIIVMLAFAKYPTVRYFIVGFELIIFCLSYFLTKIKSLLPILLILLLTISFIQIVNIYWRGETARFNPIMASRQIYISNNLSRSNILWGYGVESVYGELQGWTTGWSDNVFGEQFKDKSVLYLNYDFKYINSLGGIEFKRQVFDVCWDKAYLLKKDVVKFIDMYKDEKLTAIPIPGDENIYEIISTHCTMNNNMILNK